MGDLPLMPGEIDAGWLTTVLRRAGTLRDARVTDFTTEQVGVGMLGDSIRFALRYDRHEDAAPASVVGKFASPDPVSRATGMDYGLYLKEVRFYQEVASTVAVRAPHCHFADIDEGSGAFALILEDMAPARVGNQLTGCSLADARVAMVQAAALHGPRWNDATLLDKPYLNDGGRGGELLKSVFPACLAEFHRRYDGVLEPEYMAVCDAYGAVVGDFVGRDSPHRTLLHLDFRLDNMLFDARDGAVPLAVVDWQSISIGAGALDVAYFMGLALPIELRRAHERELLELYLDALGAYGVRDYGFDALMRDYRITLLQGLSTAIFASASTKRTERGDAMFLAMARGGCAQAIDAESLRALAAG